jgi:hypothetical protein
MSKDGRYVSPDTVKYSVPLGYTDDINDAFVYYTKSEASEFLEIGEKVVEITTNVLTQLYKNLWIKRNFWKTGLTNKSN